MINIDYQEISKYVEHTRMPFSLSSFSPSSSLSDVMK